MLACANRQSASFCRREMVCSPITALQAPPSDRGYAASFEPDARRGSEETACALSIGGVGHTRLGRLIFVPPGPGAGAGGVGSPRGGWVPRPPRARCVGAATSRVQGHPRGLGTTSRPAQPAQTGRRVSWRVGSSHRIALEDPKRNCRIGWLAARPRFLSQRLVLYRSYSKRSPSLF